MTIQRRKPKFAIEVIDDVHAALNPWGLNSAECLCVRKICELGGSKQALGEIGVSQSVLTNTLNKARVKMSLRGQNVHLWIMWDRWIRSDASKPAAPPIPKTEWVR